MFEHVVGYGHAMSSPTTENRSDQENRPFQSHLPDASVNAQAGIEVLQEDNGVPRGTIFITPPRDTNKDETNYYLARQRIIPVPKRQPSAPSPQVGLLQHLFLLGFCLLLAYTLVLHLKKKEIFWKWFVGFFFV